ncbi:EthD domain-containing protein [Nocardia takedensis]|uniref:EthD domain-containing protein n=1 Tax=Nocardia takedensis TaxID=259390 RepID=UPI0002F3EE4F|nr:EthD domain-containing protein [Nocardia takedensis]
MPPTKLVFALWEPRDQVAEELTARCRAATALCLNLADAAVAGAMLRLTAFDRPVQAVVSVDAVEADIPALVEEVAACADRVAGWRVREFRPIEPPATASGERTPGLANVAFLRRPADLPHDRWLEAWRTRHTPVAIDTQATFGYVQNLVLDAVTPDAPEIAAIVEELFPMAALTDPHAFYGSDGDPAELTRRVEIMMRSVATFGADRDIDVVPTSRYVLR